MKYKVVEAESVEELERKVANLLELGWQPDGALVMGSNPRMFYREMLWLGAEAEMTAPQSDYGQALLALAEENRL